MKRTLPLLEYTAKLFSVDFSNTLIICVQHLLPTTYTLFHKLLSLGLKPQNLIALGKCYSTAPFVLKALINEGVNVFPASSDFDSHVAYDFQFNQILERFLQCVLRDHDFDSFEKVIFLDDGGHLLKTLHKSKVKLANVIGIEQTSSGFNSLSTMELKIPIINLARAWSKLHHETPIIIRRSLDKLSECITKLHPMNTNVLILGKGVLGTYVFEMLQKKCHVIAYDNDSRKSCISIDQLPKTIASSGIIIGCSGTISMPQPMHAYLSSSTILISLSSTDREFDAVNLRKQLPIQTNCHTDLQVHGIHLVNSGFPVNFDENYHSVDTEEFQFTRSLIFASIAQAQLGQNMMKGFIDLDNLVQEKIVTQFLKGPQ